MTMDKNETPRRRTVMENRTTFDLRIAAHQREIARINAENWQHQAAVNLPARLRTALASLRTRRATRPTPTPRSLGQATLERPL
jgi:hypothetical protein